MNLVPVRSDECWFQGNYGCFVRRENELTHGGCTWATSSMIAQRTVNLVLGGVLERWDYERGKSSVMTTNTNSKLERGHTLKTRNV
jgi:hypothetical protein